jgi:hypothetical protein
LKETVNFTSDAKNELIKEAKSAIDSLYKLYAAADKNKVNSEKILNSIDESFEHLNETLNLLVTEEVTDKKETLVEALSINEIDKEIDFILAKLRKYQTYGKLPPWAKDEKNRLQRRYDTLLRQKERMAFSHAIPKIKQVLKQFGLRRSTYQSTAIRGYSIPSTGYEFNSNSPNHLEFNGIGKDAFAKIKSAIAAAGVHIEKFSEPSKTIGGSVHSSITFR